MNISDRIELNPSVCSGKAVIRGTRIPVSVILEQIAEGVWSVFYGPVHLGWLDEADYRIMDVKERTRRRR